VPGTGKAGPPTQPAGIAADIGSRTSTATSST